MFQSAANDVKETSRLNLLFFIDIVRRKSHGGSATVDEFDGYAKGDPYPLRDPFYLLQSVTG